MKSNRHRSKFPKGPTILILIDRGSVLKHQWVCSLRTAGIVTPLYHSCRWWPDLKSWSGEPFNSGSRLCQDSCTTNIHLQVGVAPLLRGFLELQQETCQWEALSMFKAQRRFLLLWQSPSSSWLMPQFRGYLTAWRKGSSNIMKTENSWQLDGKGTWVG